MADASAGSGGKADSYIGSLISLTSKSEIRYEGVLYTVDRENLNIALQDVRSFGTEGRKKDGPQISPSDKIYDYIIFRGSDIKDLQVKSSPPIQTAQAHPHHDPAIISLQAQTSQGAPFTSSFMPSPVGNLTGGGDQGPYPRVPSAAHRSNVPSLHQPGAGLGSWAPPPAPPAANGSLALPMYWPGFYRPPPTGISHLQHQSPIPFQPPPTLPATYLAHSQSLSQQQSSVPVSLSTAIPAAGATQMLPVQQPNLLVSFKDPLVTAAVSSNLVTSSAALPALSLPVPAVAPLIDSSLTSALEDRISATATVAKLPQRMVGSVVSGSHLVDSAGTIQSSVSEPKLIEPPTTTLPLISTPPPSQVQKTTAEPLLPLPPLPVNPSHHTQANQANGSLRNISHVRRGRGRDRGIGMRQPQRQFTEDFDFIAMNEKFNKDEVWGELGKGDSRDKGDGEEDDTEDGVEEDDLPRVPVYVKDDFFDSLSCDALGRGGQAERTRFSEQRKIDTETFGRFPVRSRSGRGGQGGYRGGYRGSYYGGQGKGGSRGSGNGGRGRGVSRSSAAI